MGWWKSHVSNKILDECRHDESVAVRGYVCTSQQTECFLCWTILHRFLVMIRILREAAFQRKGKIDGESPKLNESCRGDALPEKNLDLVCDVSPDPPRVFHGRVGFLPSDGQPAVRATTQIPVRTYARTCVRAHV